MVDVIPIIEFAPTPILHNYDEFVKIINFQPTTSQKCQHSNYRKNILNPNLGQVNPKYFPCNQKNVWKLYLMGLPLGHGSKQSLGFTHK